MAVGFVQCDGCDGCGHVADTVSREPWIYHTQALVDENGTPIAPLANKLPCGKCNGSGRIPIHKRNDWRRKRRID